MAWRERSVANLSSRGIGFSPSPFGVGFVVDKVALATYHCKYFGLLQVHRFPLITVISPMPHVHISLTESVVK